jgi:hypothetical protein
MFFSITNKWGAFFGTICGMFTMLWIAVGAIIVNPQASRLNVSIEGCYNESIYFNTSTGPIFSFNETQSSLEGIEKFYALSYMWYTAFGALVTVVTGLIMSVLTCGFRNKVDRSLLLFDLTGCSNEGVSRLQEQPLKLLKNEDDVASMVVDFDLKERF